MSEQIYIGFICVLVIVCMALVYAMIGGFDKSFKAILAENDEFYDDSVEGVDAAEETTENELQCYTIYDIPLSEDLQIYTQEVCGNHGIDPKIIYGIMAVESSFDPKATNGNCYGLMQVNDINLNELFIEIGVANLFDPEQNISAGIYLFNKALQNNNGDVHKALIEYNCGRAKAETLFNIMGVNKNLYSEKVIDEADGLKVKARVYE